jgi:hypothetical protein
MIETALARIDWLTDTGSRIMKAAAGFAWLGAIAATLAAFSVLGAGGWALGALCLLPGWILWRYGVTLSRALDIDRIRGQLDEAVALAKTRIGDVAQGIQATRRQAIRGGLTVLRTVRQVRRDLAGFGIDVSGIAEITNAANVATVGVSLFAALGLWVVAAVGGLVRIIL